MLPTEKKEVNLSSIKNMKNNFGVEYGYSDHTIGVERVYVQQVWC